MNVLSPIHRMAATVRTKIALIIPSSNTVMENDLHSGLPKDRFTVHADRMYLVETTREAEIRMIEDFSSQAASDLATLKPDLIVFGCTSAGSLFGLPYDASVCEKLGKIAGCPSQGVITAVAEAITRQCAKRIAVITPYNEDLTLSVAKAVEADGRTVVAAHGMGITDNRALADPTPDDIVKFGCEKLAGTDFDLLFASCTNFRALEAKPAIEEAFSRPVVTSNSAVLEAIRSRFNAR